MMTMDTATPPLLGDSMLDRDHIKLFQLTETLLAEAGNAMLVALDALRAEAADHFGREDADLRRLGGSNVSCHLDEHAEVLKSLDEVRSIISDPATSAAVAERVVVGLTFELRRWLPEHINQMDSGLATERSRSRFGGAPLRLLTGLRVDSNPARNANASTSLP